MALKMGAGGCCCTLRSMAFASALLWIQLWTDSRAFALSRLECHSIDGFWCKGSQRCIAKSLLCNNVTDCRDSEDERTCNGTDGSEPQNGLLCVNGRYWCKRSSTCVPAHARCDNKLDCQYGEDEYSCSTAYKGAHPERVRQKECRTKERFWCNESKACVSLTAVCDRKIDCASGEDERGCDYITTASAAANEQTSTQKTDFTVLTSAIAGVSSCLTVLLVAAVVRYCCLNKRSTALDDCCPQQATSARTTECSRGDNTAATCSRPPCRSLSPGDPPPYADVVIAAAIQTQAEQQPPPAYEAARNSQLHHPPNIQQHSDGQFLEASS